MKPIMLSELCRCPIGIGADRVVTAKNLLTTVPSIDILVADDGLQHYALARDLEVIVQRQQAYGNGFCLPAGPLRETKARLKQADLVIDREGDQIEERFGTCWNLLQPDAEKKLSDFTDQSVYALAGIGFPQLFFEALQQQGLDVTAHAFADHYEFSPRDINGLTDQPLLVTYKDAVKLRPFATDNIWVVPLELTLSDELQYQLNHMLESKLHG